MILIKPGNKAAVITFPSIKEAVIKILLRWYTEEKAKQYANNVQRFFEENARFPEDAIYKLEDGVFYLLDIQNSAWKKTEDTKTSCVISDTNSKFWEEFDKKLPYLGTYKADIQKIIFDTTKKMFDVEVQKISFVSRDINGIVSVGINENSAIKSALCDYVNPQEHEAYITRILAEVFHSDDMPIFVIDKGITVAAITSSSISKDVDDTALPELLKKSFSADDAQNLQIRIMNAIKYGIDHLEEVVINEYGEFVLNIGGLHVLPFGDSDKYCSVAQDQNNSQFFSKIIEKNFTNLKRALKGSYNEPPDEFHCTCEGHSYKVDIYMKSDLSSRKIFFYIYYYSERGRFLALSPYFSVYEQDDVIKINMKKTTQNVYASFEKK